MTPTNPEEPSTSLSDQPKPESVWSSRISGLRTSGRSHGVMLFLCVSGVLLVAATLLLRDYCRGPADPGIIYGRRADMDLMLDVLPAQRPTGAAVLVIQSGGWESQRTPLVKVHVNFRWLLDRGFTVVAVWHGSTLSCTVPQVVGDVHRAVRFVRLHAAEYGLDPNRLGVYGVSSGGHLALMLATTGDDGNPTAMDPVDRYPSRVATVVAVSPPTDLREWITDPPEKIRRLPTVMQRLAIEPSQAAEVSPVLRVTPRTAPTLLVHGDRDELVPADHSRAMAATLKGAGVRYRLVEVEGGRHTLTATQYADAAAAWFEEMLAPTPDR